MAGNGGLASHPLRLPYAVSIEPKHKSPLPQAVREKWSQSRKENSAEDSPKAESPLSELAESERRVRLPGRSVPRGQALATPLTLHKAAQQSSAGFVIDFRTCTTGCFLVCRFDSLSAGPPPKHVQFQYIKTTFG